jgi:hypothetical protein
MITTDTEINFEERRRIALAVVANVQISDTEKLDLAKAYLALYNLYEELLDEVR